MALDDRKTSFKYVGTTPDRPDGLDKVTGRARYGADAFAPGMLHGAFVRSPHAHAKILKIDASKALALKGVKAVVTRADFPTGLTGDDWDLLENVMAGDKALYDGHAVAAVAATSHLIARDAAKLIEVVYEPLAHVTDVDAAMQPGAPVIREGAADYSVPEGMHPNVVRRFEFEITVEDPQLRVVSAENPATVEPGQKRTVACFLVMPVGAEGDRWTEIHVLRDGEPVRSERWKLFAPSSAEGEKKP